MLGRIGSRQQYILETAGDVKETAGSDDHTRSTLGRGRDENCFLAEIETLIDESVFSQVGSNHHWRHLVSRYPRTASF